MTTTIAVKEDTMEMLKWMKQETESESFDETIKKVIRNSKRANVNEFFGKYKGLGKFTRDKKDRLYK